MRSSATYSGSTMNVRKPYTMPSTTAVGVNRIRNVPKPMASLSAEAGPFDPSRNRIAKMRTSPLVQNGIITSTSSRARSRGGRVAR